MSRIALRQGLRILGKVLKDLTQYSQLEASSEKVNVFPNAGWEGSSERLP